MTITEHTILRTSDGTEFDPSERDKAYKQGKLEK